MRGKRAKLRVIAPDPKYGSVLIGKFINHVMQRGKKSVAQKIVYSALENVVANASTASAQGGSASGGKATADKSAQGTVAKVASGKKDPVRLFEDALRNVQPQLEIRTRRVGGANYQVPMPVRGERQNALAFRWIIGAARAKKGQEMAKKLATVLLEASQGLGDAVKKRDEVHRMAEANKAFAHFARFSK